MLTKREIINGAFEEIGLGTYAYSMQAEDYQSGLTRLNALLAQWTSNGAAGGYNTGGLDGESGVPSDAERGVICGLAVDLCPSFGKTPSPQTMVAARQGKRLMMRKSAVIPEKATAWQDIPMGAGWKRRTIINFTEADNDISPDERYADDN